MENERLNNETYQPYISVVTCAYNGSRYIKDCLASLSIQRYPKDRYEIIVVDDGSTDDTAKIAEENGARVIRHETNQGIPSARNSGLRAAKNEIIAFIDSDCKANPDWLNNLVQPFKDSSVAATGGKIVAYKSDRFSERYLLASGYGHPAPIEFGKAKTSLERFWVYLKNMFSPVTRTANPIEVQAVFTANAAYRVTALEAVNGFDEALLSDEDTDISSRIRKNGGMIIYSPHALVYHRHHEQISKFIKQTYHRAENTFRYYVKEKKTLPLFPFPFLYLVLAVAFTALWPFIGLLFILTGPFLLYSWWIVRAIREKTLEYLIYGYIQFVIEIATILGLVRGVFKTSKEIDPAAQSSGVSIKSISIFSIAWMVLMTIVIFINNASLWATTPVVLVGIIIIPGLLLAINLRIKSNRAAEYFIYSLGLGLAYLIIGGLAINWILPLFGILQPLAKLPLTVVFDGSVLILAFCALIFNKDTLPFNKPRPPNGTSLFFGILPMIFLFASILGAQSLNNFGSGILTLFMLFGISIYVVALICFRRSIEEWVYISAIYLMGLSVLFMYSLRSAHIIGWDINAEYQVFQATLQNLVWKMSYFPKLDYNACISITILPTIFQELTRMSSEYVFKIIFQILFASTPVIVYVLAKRYLTSPFAFLASFLLISQTWFFEQMPALIRQETAFIFYATLILVLFDRQLKKSTRYILFYTFTVALILSHYSTAYTWLTLMFGVLILSYASRFFIKSLRKQPKIIKPIMFAISLVFLFIWEVPVTHTAAAVVSFVSNSGGEIIDSLTPSVLQGEFMKTLFVGNNPNTNLNVQLAEQDAVYRYGSQSGFNIYPDANDSGYTPMAIDDSIYVPAKVPSIVSKLIAVSTQASKLLFIDIFPIIGILGMYLSLRRRKPKGDYDFVLLNVGAYALIVLMIFIPYLQEYYNFTRLYLQMFLVLSTLAVVGGVIVTSYLPKFRILVLAIMSALIFCSLSGAFDQLTGGQARVTLDQPRGTLDTFYIYDAEIAGAQWLEANRNYADPVQADVIANLRLQSFGNMTATNNAIFPQTLEENGYIYMISANITQGHAFAQYQNNTLVYNYPIDFINSHKDLIYNNGGSKIYK